MGITTHNAEGLPAVPLTEEQRYLFDTRGWLLLPGVLPEDEAATMRDYATRLALEPLSLPASHRSSIGGPLERLTDHPVLLGFMNEFVAHPGLASPVSYGFRLENSFLAYRRPGSTNFQPHGGSGWFNFPGNSHDYRALPGRAHSGLTRAVWELAPVRHRRGGTLFLTGSHKAAFPRPASTEREDAALWETYECPAGSLLFFTEAITHTGATWTDESCRVAIFSCYNVVGAKWHCWEPHPEHVAAMPPLRQTLFRGVYVQNNLVGEERHGD